MNTHPVGGAEVNGSGAAPTEFEFNVSSAITISMGLYTPSRRWSVPSSTPTQKIYLCTLDGPSGSGLDSLSLSMSSLQLRLRDGYPSYIGAVIPIEDQSILTDIEARDGGTLTIQSGVRMNDGTEVTEIIATGTMDGFRYDMGTHSGSVTIVAYGTETTTTSKYVDLTGVQVVGRYNTGKRYVRCDPSCFLRPGDVAVWDDGDMIVALISIIVNDRRAYMNLTER